MAITQPGDTTVISFVSVPGDAGPATRAESVQGGFVALPSGSGPPTTTNLPLPLRRAGTLAYTPSDNKFWQLIGGTADVNWVEKASVGNGGLITVVDNSARDAIPATVRAEGMIVYSKKTKLYYSLDADLTTWRAIGSNPSLVAQAAWYVSQATGNDSNSGTILDPIASLDGIRERLNPGGATLRPAQNTTVYVLDGTFPELALAIAIPVGSNYTFDVRCTVASSASFTLATVVDSALTASPIRGRITTASALLTDKAFIRTTNGANPGAIAIVDGLNSSTDAYVKPWLYEVSANNIFNVNIAPGTSCVVDTLQVTINRVRIVNSGGTPVGGAVRIFGAIIPHGIEWVNVVGGSGGFYAYECIIGTTNLAENAKVSGNCGVRSCRIIGAGTGVTANFSVQGLLDVIFLGCSIEAQISIGAAETQFIRGCTFNGGSLAVGFPGNGAPFHAGVGLSEPNQWVNGAGLTAVTVQTNAYLSISDQQAGFGAAYATGIALVSGAKATASSIALLGINATQQVTMVGRKHTYAQLPKDYPNSDCTFSLASDLSGLPSGFPDLTVSDWYVSPSGSDTTGDGLSLGTAFATTERLGAVLCPGGTTLTVRQNTIVHLAAGTYNAIELSLSFPIGSNYTFDVKGDFTSSSPITLSSVTNTVEGVPGTAVRGAIATASGTFVDKGRIRSTSGASVGAITYCTGLNGDAQHAFVKEWFLESSFSAVNIANGTTCVVDTLGVTINRVQIRTSGHKIDGTFRINDVILPNGAEFINTVSGSNNVGLSQCQIGNSTGVSCRFSGNLQTRNCRFTGSSAITFLGMAIPVIWGCAIESVLICSLASMQVYANNCFNGGSLIAGGNGTSQGNYGIAIGATEWVNGAGLTAISCQPGSSVRVIGQQFSFGTAYAVGWALDSGALCVTDTVAHLGPAATQPITMTGHNVNYTDVPRTYPNAACYFVLLSDPSSLPFAAPPVTSVFGRLGAIAAALNDYTSSLVQNLSSVTSGGTTVTSALNALQTQIAASVSGVSSVFGRSGAVAAAAGDYTDALINNTSTVAGAHVKDALDALKSSIVALVTGVSSVYGRTGAVAAASGDYNSTQVTNSSSVSGSTVTAALNTLLAALSSSGPITSVFGRTGAVAAVSGDYTSSLVTNASAVAGASVTSALNLLNSTIAALNSSSIANVSSVAGGTVTLALNALLAAIAALTSNDIDNFSVVSGSTVSDALNTLRFSRYVGVDTRSGSYTLATSDKNKLIKLASDSAITVPAGVFTDGDEVDFVVTGGSVHTFVAGTNVFIAAPENRPLLDTYFVIYQLRYISISGGVESFSLVEIGPARTWAGEHNVPLCPAYNADVASGTVALHVTGGGTVGPVPDYWMVGNFSNSGNVGVRFTVPLGVLPSGALLTEVRVRIYPFPATGTNFPTVMPRLDIWTTDSSGNGVLVGSVTDGSASKAAYETNHELVLSGLSFTVGTQGIYATLSTGQGSLIGGTKVLGMTAVLS